MKTLSLALIMTISSVAAALDWRDVGPRTPLHRLVTTLHELAAETAPEGPTPALFAALPAFAEPTSLVSDLYLRRLTVAERARLRERLPGLVEGLTADEPRLALALAKLRREENPAEAKRPLRMVLRDYSRIAWAKIRGRKFVIGDKSLARTTARAITRFEALVNAYAAEPQAMSTPDEEVLEVLGDLPALTDRMDVVARFISERLDRVDLTALPRRYRETYPLASTIDIAAHIPELVAALDRIEPAPVVKTRDRMRGRDSRLSFESDLKLGLKAEGLKSVGSFAGRLLKSLEANLAKARSIEMRAHRLLRLEEIVRDGAEATCADGLDEFTRLVSRPIFPRRHPQTK